MPSNKRPKRGRLRDSSRRFLLLNCVKWIMVPEVGLIKLRSWPFSPLLLPAVVLFCLASNELSHGQVLYQDQEIQVHNLPSLKARSHDPSDVLLTSLDTILHNRDFCCGKDSALED